MTASTTSPRWRAPSRIETARLDLRALGPEHVGALQEVVPRNKAHLTPAMPWAQHEPLSIEARTELLQQMRGRFDLGLDFAFGLFERASGRFVGGAGLHPRIGPNALEIGYWIDAGWQGQGLVSEAVGALCFVALEIMSAHRVEIRCSPANARSKAIPERLGFHLDGVLREIGASGTGEVEDRMIWTLLRSEYPRHPLFAAPRPRLFDPIGAPIATALDR